MNENKANLFLVGAMKAGTTAFVDLIGQHSSIYVSPIKEPHYFVNILPKEIYEPSRFFSIKKYLSKEFPKPLHIANITDEEDYRKLFSLASEKKYLLEASTGYLHAPEAAERIFRYNPKAKILILTRKPLQRAFSHYKMDVALGRTSRTFTEVLQANLADFRAGELSPWSYLGMSLYSENASRFISRFGKEHVHIIGLEDYISNHDVSLNSLHEFLNIDAEPLILKQKNSGKELTFPKVFYLLKKTGLKDVFSYVVPQKLRHRLFRNLSSEKKSQIHLPSNLLEQLNTLFEEDQQKLSSYL